MGLSLCGGRNAIFTPSFSSRVDQHTLRGEKCFIEISLVRDAHVLTGMMPEASFLEQGFRVELI